MAKIRFRDLEYEIPEFTNRELMEIERVSGIPTSEVEAGLSRGSVHYSTMMAWAWIAIKRSGATITLDELLDAPVGSVALLKDEEEEAEADRPFDAGDGEDATPGPAGAPPSPNSSA